MYLKILSGYKFSTLTHLDSLITSKIYYKHCLKTNLEDIVKM